MSSTSIPLSDLGSGTSAKFTEVGDKCVGRIVAIEQRQQTDPKDGTPKFWNDGSPRMQWLINVETDTGDVLALWARGGNYEVATGKGEAMLTAIGSAVRESGANSLDVGGQLAVAHTGMGKPPAPGLNQPRLFTAQYAPPAPKAVQVDDLFGPSKDGDDNDEPF